MDPLTFDASVGGATLKLQSTSAIVPTTVSFSLDYKTVTLTPSAPLTPATVYTITLDGNLLTDMAGYLLRPSRTESFTAQ